MIEIISPGQFKSSLWKNGKGTTTELAISANSTITNFQWRLSIANVVEDGLFSDFRGYCRNLILISGQGLRLEHQNSQQASDTSVDQLDSLLKFATFDGANITQGTLIAGAITDFNLMHNPDSFSAQVTTYVDAQTLKLTDSDICFIYPLADQVTLTRLSDNKVIDLAKGHLLKLSNTRFSDYQLSGKQMIIINLTERLK